MKGCNILSCISAKIKANYSTITCIIEVVSESVRTYKNMGDVDWELIVDNRFKYAKEDPEWYRVSLKDAALKLSDRSMSGTCVLAARFKVYLPHIFNYDVRADDVWIQTYPRSGNLSPY